MSKNSGVEQFIELPVGGHPGSIYSTNQDGVPEAFARLQASDTAFREHRMVMWKTRDGMSGHFGVTAEHRNEQHTTGLLAGLMRRI